MKEISKKRSFGGWQYVYEHQSSTLDCTMQFAIYLPDSQEEKMPALWFLSGLTCSWENVTQKGFAQAAASKHNVIFIAPDTSPRGETVPDDERWDFGKGASFYVDATQEPWSKNYKMYTYIVSELQALVAQHFKIDVDRQGICGHSMGGHGALVLGLRNPDLYKSISAFSPIANPSIVPWGELAFSRYLGDSREDWEAYDATHLVSKVSKTRGEILIDQGEDDSFLSEQLKPENFVRAAKKQDVNFRIHHGYDHSYFFVSTFMADHFAHFVNQLNNQFFE